MNASYNNNTMAADNFTSGNLTRPEAAAGVDQLVLSVVASIVSLSAVTLNVVVLATLGRTKSLRRLQNVFVASLAVADLMRATIVIPLYIASLTGCSWFSTDSAGCIVYRFFSMMLEAAVVYGSALVGVERAFLISRPLTYPRIVTSRRMAIVVTVTWILCALFGGLHTGLILSDLPKLPTSSNDNYRFSSVTCFLTSSVWYASLDVILGVIVPFIVLFISYAAIFRIVRSQMRRIEPPVSTNTGGVGGEETRGGSTWTTSVSGSRNTKDIEVFSDDRTTVPTVSGNLRRHSMTSRRCSSSSLTRVTCENGIPAGHVLVDIAEDESHGYCAGSDQELTITGDDVTVNNQLSGKLVHSSGDSTSSAFPGCNPTPPSQSHYIMIGNENTGCGNVRGNNSDERLPITDDLCSVTRLTRESSTSDITGSNSAYPAASNRRRSSVTFSVPDYELPSTWQGRVQCGDQSSNEPASYLPNVETPSEPAVDQSHRSTPAVARAPYRQHAVSVPPKQHPRPNASTPAEYLRPASVSEGDDPYSTVLRRSNVAPPTSTDMPRWTSGAEHGGYVRSVPRTSVVSLAPSTRQNGSDPAQRRQSILGRIHNNKAVRMTFIVVGAFLVCWTPVSVTHLVRVTNSSVVSSVTWDAVVLVSLAASVVNPLIYNFYSAEFRRAATRLLTCNRYMSGSPFY